MTRSGVQLEAVTSFLPCGFAAMQTEARAEGYRFLDRLAAEWEARTAHFARPGEKLLAAHFDNELAGIGGLTLDPVVSHALRMRRFYIRAAFRRGGIGSALATALLDEARCIGRLVVVNAAAGSEAFWESLGFVPDRRDGHSHVFVPTNRSRGMRP
jgi:GNAT superfamily N-acetyltransferase